MTAITRPAIDHSGLPADRDSRTRRAWNLTTSEWTKLGSVRSTYWSLTIGAAVAIVFAVAAAPRGDSLSPAQRATFDPVGQSLYGMLIAQLVIAILGACAITTEYSTGLIRATLTAAPHRAAVLAAKAAVVATIAGFAGTAIAAMAFLTGQVALAHAHLNVPVTDPGAWRAVAGVGFYCATIGLLGVGAGAVIRHTAAAVSASPQHSWSYPNSPWPCRLPGTLASADTCRQTSAGNSAHSTPSPAYPRSRRQSCCAWHTPPPSC